MKISIFTQIAWFAMRIFPKQFRYSMSLLALFLLQSGIMAGYTKHGPGRPDSGTPLAWKVAMAFPECSSGPASKEASWFVGSQRSIVQGGPVVPSNVASSKGSFDPGGDIDLLLEVPAGTYACGDEVTYFVKVRNFTDVVNDLTFSLNWDPGLLNLIVVTPNNEAFEENGGSYPSLEDYPVVQHPAVGDAGKLTFAWGDGKSPFGELVLNDEEVLLTLTFRVINTKSGNPVVVFSNDPTPVGAIENNEFDELNVNLKQRYVGEVEDDEEVQDVGGEGAIELAVDENTDCDVDLILVVPTVDLETNSGPFACGTVVEYEVLVRGFQGNINDLTFSLNWDPGQLNLMSTTSNDAAFAANGGSDPLLEDYPVVQYPAVGEAGKLTFAWGDGKAPFYQSLPDETWLLKLQFRVINATLGNPVVVFSNDPTPVNAIDNYAFDELDVNKLQKLAGGVEQNQDVEGEGPIELEVDVDTNCDVDLILVVPTVDLETNSGPFACGTVVEYEVLVRGFQGNINDLTFSLNWDPGQLNLMSTTSNDAAFAANGGLDPLLEDYPVVQYPAVGEAGKLTFAWGDGKAPFYQSLPDGTWLLKLQFRVINTTSGNPVVEFSDDPTPVNAIDNYAFDELDVNKLQKLAGGVEQNQDDEGEGPIELEVDETSECQVDLMVVVPQDTDIQCGAEVEFAIKVNGFNGSLSDLQFSLAWDPAQLEYISHEYDPLLYGASGSTDPTIEDVPDILEFSSERLTYVWGDGKPPFFQSMPDGSTLFTVKFKVIEASNPISLSIVDDPTEALAINNYTFDELTLNRLDDGELVVQGIAPPSGISVIPFNGAALVSFSPPTGIQNATYQYRLGPDGAWQDLPEDFTIPQAIIPNLNDCEEYEIYLRTIVDGSPCPGISSDAVTVTPNADNDPLATNWVTASTVPTSTPTQVYTRVKYGGGWFVATALSGTDRILRSPDGVNWTRVNVPPLRWESLAYCPDCSDTGGGRFVAGSRDGDADQRVIYSDDFGATWQTATDISDIPVQWSGMAYGDGIFIAVSFQGYWMSSTDGKVWTEPISVPGSWYGIDYGVVNGTSRFVSLSRRPINNQTGLNGVMIISKVNDQWTYQTYPEVADPSGLLRTWEDVAYGNGRFIGVARTGSHRVMTSENGIDWVNVATPRQAWWRQVVYGKGYFVSVTSDAQSDGRHVLMSTDNGTTWNSYPSVGPRSWAVLGFGDDKFVAFATGNALPAAMVSGLVVPGLPELVPFNIGEAMAQFTIEAPDYSGNAGSLTYEYSLNNGVSWNNVAAFPNLIIEGLECGREYELQVRAINHAGSSCATILTFNTDPCAFNAEISGRSNVAGSGEISDISVRPNPTKTGMSNLVFELSKPTLVRIRIMNAQGVLVSDYNAFYETGNHVKAVEVQSQGLYFIELVTQNGSKTLRLVNVP